MSKLATLASQYAGLLNTGEYNTPACTIIPESSTLACLAKAGVTFTSI